MIAVYCRLFLTFFSDGYEERFLRGGIPLAKRNEKQQGKSIQLHVHVFYFFGVHHIFNKRTK